MIKLNLDKSDVENAADLIECYFFQNIRDDEGINNIGYVRSILKCLDELRAASK